MYNNINIYMNNNEHNAPLTDAERAERIRRLNELYQQQQQQHQLHYYQQQLQHQQQQQQVGYQHHTLHQGSTVQPYNDNHCYVEEENEDDDGNDVDDDGIDNGEEAFLDKMEQHMSTLQSNASAPHAVSGNVHDATQSDHAASTSSTQTTFYRIEESEMNTGTVIATEANVQRRTIGDFELLRLAKVGDKESFYHFASMTHTTIASFQDNQKRNALHYAADSGNLLLIRALH